MALSTTRWSPACAACSPKEADPRAARRTLVIRVVALSAVFASTWAHADASVGAPTTWPLGPRCAAALHDAMEQLTEGYTFAEVPKPEVRAGQVELRYRIADRCDVSVTCQVHLTRDERPPFGWNRIARQ